MEPGYLRGSHVRIAESIDYQHIGHLRVLFACFKKDELIVHRMTAGRIVAAPSALLYFEYKGKTILDYRMVYCTFINAF